MKKLLSFWLLIAAMVVIGCGGGGGGGGGTTDGTTNGGTTSTTTGNSGGTTASVSGRVKSELGSGIANVEVRFYLGDGTQVGAVTTTSTGTFSRRVDPATVRFGIVGSTIPAGFFKTFFYNTKFFIADQDICKAHLPTLSVTGNNPLPTDIQFPISTGPPPPPPTGCE